MRKSIIISGPRNSGKNHIANAIANQHSSDKVLIVTAHTFKKEIKNRVNIEYFKSRYDILIVDDCSRDDVFIIDNKMNPFRVGAVLKSIFGLEKDSLQLVYLSQNTISERPGYYVINCNNDIF